MEQRKLDILDRLKAQNGPFTCTEEVDEYLISKKFSDNEKQKRMRDEITYARDTSQSLPRASPFFKIYYTTVTPETFIYGRTIWQQLEALFRQKIRAPES